MKTQIKMPHQLMILVEHFKTKYHVFFFPQKGEKTYVVIYNTRGVQCESTRGVQCKSTRCVCITVKH